MEQSRPSNKARVFKEFPKHLRNARKVVDEKNFSTEDVHETVARIHRHYCRADKLNNMNKVLETES